MVTNLEIRKRLMERPFQPFRLIMKSGETHDVYRPDFIMVLRTRLAIGYPPRDDFPDGIRWVSVGDVTAMVTIPTTERASRDGSTAPGPMQHGLDKTTVNDLLHEFPDLRELLPCLRNE